MSETVSVVVPVYNGERFVKEAVESALGQTSPPIEVIVVDDGSTDGSEAVLRSLPVTYVRQANAGPSAARNHGVSLARGDFLAFIDQDDVWLPHKLETQLAALRQNPDADYALCHLRFLFDETDPPPAWFHQKGPAEGEPGFEPGCWLVPRRTWERVGEFNADRRYTQDMDWIARANDLGLSQHIVPEVLTRKRIHGSNLLGHVEAAKREMLRTVFDSVGRKRAQPNDER